MKIQIFKSMALLASTPTGHLPGGNLEIAFSGSKDVQMVKLYKDGRTDLEQIFYIKDGKVFVNVTPGRYVLRVAGDSVRFTVYETPDKKLHVHRTKTDPEKTLQKMINLCVEMMREINIQNQKIDNLSGYETE